MLKVSRIPTLMAGFKQTATAHHLFEHVHTSSMLAICMEALVQFHTIKGPRMNNVVTSTVGGIAKHSANLGPTR